MFIWYKFPYIVSTQDARKLEQVYCDPVQRLVADCVLMDVNTAVVSDRKGSIAVLSCANYLEGTLICAPCVTTTYMLFLIDGTSC